MDARNAEFQNAGSQAGADLPSLVQLDDDQVQVVRFFLEAKTRYLFVALHIEEFRRKRGRAPSSGELRVPTFGFFDDRTLRRMLARWRRETSAREATGKPPEK